MTSAPALRSAARPRRKRLIAAAVVGVVVVVGLIGLGPRSHADHGAVTGTFDVPSSRWLGLSGMTAEVRGTLTFEGDCPVLASDEVGPGILVFPWAVGVTYADGRRAVVHQLTGGVYAVEGQTLDYGGGWHESTPGSDWQPACEGSHLEANIYVNAWPS